MGLPPEQLAVLTAEPEPDAERERRVKARRSGRRAQAMGAVAEREFARACAVYARRGLARVEKRNPGCVFDSRGRPRVVERGASDFGGHICGAGRAVYAEVKSSGKASLPLRRRDGTPTLTPAQRARLRTAWEDGCMSGVAVRITVQREGRNVARWFWLPWPAWLDVEGAAKAAGDASLSQDLLAAHGVECDTRPMHGAPDWLPAALRAEREWRRPPLNEEVLAAWLGREGRCEILSRDA